MRGLRVAVGRAHHQGLTLVELLVALVMGMVLLAGVATVFVANKQTYRLQDALARLQENGRFSIEFLERDIRMAGYTGCRNLVLKANTINDPPGSNTCSTKGMTLDGGQPVDGFDNVGVSPVASNPLGTTPAPKTGTDILRLLLGGSQGAKVIQHKDNSAQLKVTAFADLRDDDIVMVVDSNCENGSIFQITNFQNQSQHHSEVVHNTGNTNPGNCTKDLGQTYLGGRIVKFMRSAYFVADTARRVAGQPVYALYRVDTTRAGSPMLEELIEGVEDMQVLYGVGADSDGDGTVDSIAYKNATVVGTASEWPSVVSVRVQLLLHSTDPNVLWELKPVTFDINVGGATEYKAWSLTSPANKAMRQDYNTTTTVRNRVK
jgi:type IV pilus assembly protein PilW